MLGFYRVCAEPATLNDKRRTNSKVCWVITSGCLYRIKVGLTHQSDCNSYSGFGIANAEQRTSRLI